MDGQASSVGLYVLGRAVLAPFGACNASCPKDLADETLADSWQAL